MSPRERAIAAVTGLVLGGALLWTVGIDPAMTAYGKDGDKLASLERLVAAERGLVARLEGKTDEPGLRARREALERRLRPEDRVGHVPGFVAAVRSLSRTAGFEPSSIRFVRAQPVLEPAAGPGQPPRASAFAELRFELKARTSHDRLHKFLVALTAGERPARVVSLSIAPRTDGSDLDVDLSLLGLAPRDALQEKPPERPK